MLFPICKALARLSRVVDGYPESFLLCMENGNGDGGGDGNGDGGAGIGDGGASIGASIGDSIGDSAGSYGGGGGGDNAPSGGFSDTGGEGEGGEGEGGFGGFGFSEPGSLAAQADAQAAINAFGFSGLTAMGFNFADVSNPNAPNLGFNDFGYAMPSLSAMSEDPNAISFTSEQTQQAMEEDIPTETKETKTQETKNLEALQALVAKNPTLTMEIDPVTMNELAKTPQTLPPVTVTAPQIAPVTGKLGLPGPANTANPTAITGPPGFVGLNGPVNAVPGFPAEIGVTPTQSMPDIGVTSTPGQLATATFRGVGYGFTGLPSDAESQLGMPNIPQSHINTGFATIGPHTNLKGSTPAGTSIGVPISRDEALENEAKAAVLGIAHRGMNFNQAIPDPTLAFPFTAEPTAAEDAAALAKANQEAINLGYMTPEGTPGKGVTTFSQPLSTATTPMGYGYGLGLQGISTPPSQTLPAITVTAPQPAPITGVIGRPGPPNTTNPVANPLGPGLSGYGGYGGVSGVPGEGQPGGPAVGQTGGGFGTSGGIAGGTGAGQNAPSSISTPGDAMFGTMYGMPGQAGISTSAIPYGLTNFTTGPAPPGPPVVAVDPNALPGLGPGSLASPYGTPALPKGDVLGPNPNPPGSVANPNIVSIVPVTPTEPVAPPPTQQQIDKAKEDLAKDLKERAERAEQQQQPPPVVVPLPQPRPDVPVEIAKEEPPPQIIDTPLTKETLKDVEQQIEAHPLAPPTVVAAPPSAKGTLGTGITGFTPGSNLGFFGSPGGRRIAAEAGATASAASAMRSLYSMPV